MTQARAFSPDSTCTASWLTTIVARAGRVLAATCLALCATAAIGQTAFSSAITFDQDPAEYQPNDFIVATLTLSAGSSNISNVAFSATLPAGVSFWAPVLPSVCGGTASSSGNAFSLTGGVLAADTTCSLTLRITAAPATTTTYSISIPNITYTFGAGGSGTDKASADFTVFGGIPPAFTDSLPPDGRVGDPYAYPVVVDGSQPIGVTVTGLPPGLTYDVDSGEITGVPTLAGTYPAVHIVADNGFPPPADATYTIVILSGPLAVTKSFSPAAILTGGTSALRIDLTDVGGGGVAGIGFSDTFPVGMTATPSSSSICGGTLTVASGGLTFSGGSVSDTSCTISVPVSAVAASTTALVNTTSPISFNFGTVPPASGTLLVNAGVPPTITSGAPPNGVVGSTYNHVISVIGTPLVSISVSGLPPGLAFDAGTQSIRGVPTTAGTYSGTIVAQNAYAPNAGRNFTIVITNPPLSIVTNTLPPISGGEQVHVPVIAQGGIPPYRFDVLSGQLPPGLSFDPQGFLSGVPTLPGTYTFTARVTDSVGSSATKAYTIIIDKSTPSFSFDIAPNPAVAGQAVIATATLSGGTGAAAGDVQVWVAHSGERCPGVPGTLPIAAKTETATLGATSQVKFTFADLGIDHYEVCATYAGDVRYKSVSAGPFDVFVIKGALLQSPVVNIAAPLEVKANAVVTAQVAVRPVGQSAIAPSGSVLLRADGRAVGTLTLAGGSATFNTAAPAVPGHVTLSATYLGDGAFPPAVSAPAVVAVTKAEDVSATPIPALSGAALALLVSLIATVGVALRRRRRG